MITSVNLPKRPPMWLLAVTILAIAATALFKPSDAQAQARRAARAGAAKAGEPAKEAQPATEAQPAAAGATTQPASQPAGSQMTHFELFVKGGFFMIPIALSSIFGLAIIIERLVALRRRAIIPKGFLDKLKQAFNPATDDRSKGLEFCQQWDCPISRVLAAGIARLKKGEESVERAIEDAAAGEIHKLRRNMQMLFAVAAVAPMLGLVGTVTGMIRAFEVTARVGTGDAARLAYGIYEALVTTYAGLLVAIPTLVFYYYFRGKIESIVAGLNSASIEFAEHYLAGDEEAHELAPIEFKCNSCGKGLRVPADRAGKKGLCPKCKGVVIVPALA
ncbi:MAG: MotA/TolQ/ExbB proton channel family protein [Planctomycetaceae bacterium]|nr:MotA/TolQ/ExbB proton channel family protein [Planctomycetaceae bacterium]